ncbi:DUF3168 domain-containing protein [Shinella sp.]|uniref:DUF3168 domain-containing protein n=1 Tax=Shinella sp. TaxID=1870904 RepID=UPI0039E70B7F
MPSPDLELQGALLARLTAYADLSALVAGRIYDEPPGAARYPYVTLGESQFLNDDMTCRRAWRAYLTLHAWSRKTGYPEVKQVASAVADALHLANLPMAHFRVAIVTHSQTRVFRDADGATSHAVITFDARVEEIPA